jgi:ferredoxin-NADP reductase
MKAIITVKKSLPPDYLYLEYSSEQPLEFKAGQFFRLTLDNPPFTDNRGNSRYFGFINTPTQKSLAVMVTRTGPSAFKKSLAQLPIGSVVVIDDIDGQMTLPDNPHNPVVFVTSDVGIAPIMSILKYAQEKSQLYQFLLNYSPPLLFHEELALLANENPHLSFINSLPPPDNNIFYVIGIPQFVVPTIKLLQKNGVSPLNINFEIFTGY